MSTKDHRIDCTYMESGKLSNPIQVIDPLNAPGTLSRIPWLLIYWGDTLSLSPGNSWSIGDTIHHTYSQKGCDTTTSQWNE